MPTQINKKSKPGSSRRTAVDQVIDISDSDGPPLSARRTMPSRQSSRQSRTKAASLITKPAAKGTSSKSKASDNKLTLQDISSDSDESSDAPMVATSRTINKGKQRSSDNGSGSGGQTAIKRRSPVNSASSGRKPTSSTMQLDSHASSSSDSPPTPQAEPRRLLKADRTPVEKAIIDKPSWPRDARDGPSFIERLQANPTPNFSKESKGKARSSVSTSIPLNDARFASDEDDEDYESDDKPSARKSRPRKSKLPKASTSAHPIIELENSPQSQGGSKYRHMQTIEDSSDDDDELPSLPSTSTNRTPVARPSKSERHKENLEQLSQRRRLADKKSLLKQKQAKRTVASPSPEPVKVVASRPSSQILSTVSPRSTNSRLNVRAIPSAGKPRKAERPMFRPPSDDSDAEATVSASEESEPIKPMRTTKPGNGHGKGKKRKASSSSSSSSSSAESSASPDEDEISEVEEDISLNYNPVVRDKLRPKDNSKAHRLDALKQARAAKDLKQQKLRKGIIDSDEDEADKSRKVEQIEEGDDDDEGSSSSADVEDFIVPDNGDIDDEELARAARMMPIHLSGHAALNLEGHFHIFITSVVFRFFLPKSKYYRDSAEFKFSQSQVQNAINGLINSSIASSIWREDFRAALDARPELDMDPIAHSPGCQGCDKYDRTASQRAILTVGGLGLHEKKPSSSSLSLQGKSYDADTFEDDSDEDEEPSQDFDLGRFCAEKAHFHHSLRHFLKKAYEIIRDYCRTRSTLGAKLMGDKDDRKQRREEEAARIVHVLADSNVSPQRLLWNELDQLMERAKHKYLK